MILVDTSVWIDFFNGSTSNKKEQLRTLIVDQKQITLTDIILTEILQGIREETQYRKVKQTLLDLHILHATPIQTYTHAADIYRTCRKKGFTIRKTNDCIIAAIAIRAVR